MWHGTDMKRIIFSIYNEIVDDNLEKNNPYSGDTISKSQRTKLQFKKYFKQLVDVKEKYAKICQADYKLYSANSDNNYFVEFKKKYGHAFTVEYDLINFFKIYLFEQLTSEYDEIVYFDFDVIPNTDYSIFKHLNLNNINVLGVDSKKENIWSIHDLNQLKRDKKPLDEIVKIFDKQNLYCKLMTKKSMLATQGIMGNDYVTNTGILAGNKSSINNLKFFEDFEDKINILNQAIDEQMFGKPLSERYFLNNEIFFSYHLENKNIKWDNLTQDWHYMMMSGNLRAPRDELERAHLIHVMNKDFERILNLCGTE